MNDVVSFGMLNPLDTSNTTGGSPQPFEMKNIGNVKADLFNVSVNNTLWDAVGLDVPYFQIKSRIPQGNESFNTTNSVMSWMNVGLSNFNLIDALNYVEGNNSAYVDLAVTVPSDEPSGSKSATLNFVWEED